MLSNVYGSAIDYSDVQVRNGGTKLGSGFTPFSTINIGRDLYSDDFSMEANVIVRALLIHEAAHVLQNQNGRPPLINGIVPQILATITGRIDERYDFSDKLALGADFRRWTIEEQANYFESLYLRLEQKRGVPLDSWIEKNLPSLEELLAVDTSRYPGTEAAFLSADECFLAGTQISMWDGTKKPIEEVESGDIVVSYDKDGTLKPSRVKRTMTNRAKQILDVHGLMVTPGHATLCGDGRFDGQHVPILDILRSDGALVLEDGSKIRAGTGCRLGTMGDRIITAIIGEQQPDGLVRIAEVGQIRAGTRFIKADGEDVSVLDMILKSGGRLTEDGMIQTSTNGPKMPFRWTFTPSLPKPEDYVLQRSATHLQDIYQANEWESVRPSMPIPMGGEAGATISKHPAIVAAAPVNVPLALRNRPDAPQMSRKYRRAAEATARKRGGMVH